MRATLSLLFSLAFVIPCTAQMPAGPQYEGSLGAAVYSNGYIVDWDNPAFRQVTIYNPDAKPAYSMPVRGAESIHYFVWAVDSDGIAARAYEIHKPWEGRIDLLDPSGKPTLTIKTGSYLPQHVTFAPDHSIWTVGFNAGNDGSGEDFNVVRHYTRTGEELGQALLWSQIAGVNNAYTALQLVLGRRLLYAANDRIGFDSFSHDGHETWIEVGFAGNLLGKYDLGMFRELCYEPFALTADGGVYAEIFRKAHFDGWAVLDRSKGIWRKVTGCPQGRIIGSDGDKLVFSEREGARTVLQFVMSGTLRFEKHSQEMAEANSP